MYGILLGVHILICLVLIGVVLLQSGKGGGLAGGAFGGTAQTVFGGRGATDFLSRATMVLGALFFVTSMVLALMTSGNLGQRRSLIQDEARRAQPTAPQAPGGGLLPGSQAPPGQAAPTPGQGTPGEGAPPAGNPAPPPSSPGGQ